MPERLRVAYAPGVTPGKWARIWGERFPRDPLELVRLAAVTDVAAELAPLAEGGAELALIRLAAGEPRPQGFHLITLYEERPFVVAPKGHLLEAADEVTLAELEGEHRHPFDDDIETTIEVVAANVGVVVVPQSIARLHARKDVVARPLADAEGWRVGLAWPEGGAGPLQPRVEDFIGVVRGRTANSSRGGERKAEAPATPAGSDGGRRQRPQAAARPSRAGRARRRPTR